MNYLIGPKSKKVRRSMTMFIAYYFKDGAFNTIKK